MFTCFTRTFSHAMSAPLVFPLQPIRSAEPFSSLLHTRVQGRAKRGRGKAVSWPPEDQICQIRFFMSDDAPASIASGQAVFELNHIRSSCTQGSYPDASLDVPPGFHGLVAKRARINIAMSAEMTWCCPQKFIQDCDWLVADGDESRDSGVQKQRELRVLEAFYPRLTSIPGSPMEPAESVKCVDDSCVPIIPLVAIEEEDESAEDGVKEEFVSDGGVAGHGMPNNDQKSHHPAIGFPMQPPNFSKHLQDPTMDPKVAAAAACLAIHKIGANGLVDQELLLEILRNPALVKSLTLFNASRKDLAGTMNQNEIGLNGQATLNPHISSKCAGAFNKGLQGTSLSTGMPSPVSVLADWTPEHMSKILPRTPSSLSNSGDSSNVKNMSCCIPPSMPCRQSHNVYPSSDNVESVFTAFQGAHAFAEDAGLGLKAPPLPSAQSASYVHADRSCGMVAPIAPFPSQNAGNFNLSRTQPAQIGNSVPLMHDCVPCRSSYADARSRGMHNEAHALGAMSKKTSRLCMYFNTPRGCRNGGNCAFVHQLASQVLNPIAQ